MDFGPEDLLPTQLPPFTLAPELRGVKQNKENKELLELWENLAQAYGDLLGKGTFGIWEIIVKKNQGKPLLEILRELKEDWGFILMLDLLAIDWSKENSKGTPPLELSYVLLSLRVHQRLRVRFFQGFEDKVERVPHLWKGALWPEREAYDLMGVKFTGDPLKRLLTHELFKGHPLRKNYVKHPDDNLTQKTSLIPEGPTEIGPELPQWVDLNLSYPGLLARPVLALQIKDDVIQDCQLEIGQLHRCFEKLCENKTYEQILVYTDRLNYQSAALNNIGWCKAIEELMGITLSPKAQTLRMLFGELGRILDHLYQLSNTLRILGSMGPYQNFGTGPLKSMFEMREEGLSLIQAYCGSRITHSLARIGGMPSELPEGLKQAGHAFLKRLLHHVRVWQKDLMGSRAFKTRMETGKLLPQEAIAWGITGPCLRASGVNYDLRKVSPYYYYSEIDFDVPLGVYGNSLDRFLVRLEEVYESGRIMHQILEHIPQGTGLTSTQIVAEGLQGKGRGPLMQHLMESAPKPRGEVYSFTEAANGELGFAVTALGDVCPYRVKVRSPSMALAQGLTGLLPGLTYVDSITLVSTLNINIGELDR